MIMAVGVCRVAVGRQLPLAQAVQAPRLSGPTVVLRIEPIFFDLE